MNHHLQEACDFVVSDGRKELPFRGWLLGTATSRDGTDDKAEWYTALDLYRTSEGRFVAQRTTSRPDKLRTKFAVFSNRQDTMEWLGFGALSLALYESAGWRV